MSEQIRHLNLVIRASRQPRPHILWLRAVLFKRHESVQWDEYLDRGKTCGNTVCFTSNLTVAQSFNTCVRAQEDVSQAKAKKDGNLAPNAKRSGRTGNCEYIDYDVLKKGVKSRAATKSVLSNGLLIVLCLGIIAVSLCAMWRSPSRSKIYSVCSRCRQCIWGWVGSCVNGKIDHTVSAILQPICHDELECGRVARRSYIQRALLNH